MEAMNPIFLIYLAVISVTFALAINLRKALRRRRKVPGKATEMFEPRAAPSEATSTRETEDVSRELNDIHRLLSGLGRHIMYLTEFMLGGQTGEKLQEMKAEFETFRQLFADVHENINTRFFKVEQKIERIENNVKERVQPYQEISIKYDEGEHER
jgi:hypothetical protein